MTFPFLFVCFDKSIKLCIGTAPSEARIDVPFCHCERSEAIQKNYFLVLFLICVLIFSSSFNAHGENKEVYEVTATPLLDSLKTTGTYETVITDTEIEAYQETFLKDALPYAPSVMLNSNGTLGRQVDFSIRGARSSQNLVLVDGIYANDPASGGVADLSIFLNADIERIEVRPGPQNLVYGPGALGGVIQLIPKRGQGKHSLKAHGEGGSFRTKYGTVIGQGEEGPFQFSATAAGFRRGPAAFTNPVHGNRQGDRYRNETLSSRIGVAVTDNWEMEGLVRYSEGKTQFDDLIFDLQKNFFLPFKANNFSDTQTFLSSLGNKWGNESTEHSLKIAYTRIQRKTSMMQFHNKTIGEHPFLSYRSDVKINPQNILTVGGDGGQERATEHELHKRAHGGIYLIHFFKPFLMTEIKGGARIDRYQFLGNHTTFNVGMDQKLTSNTLLRASYGTNFKPPVLSDLFQKDLPWQIPNPFLKPEKSRSMEAGIDQSFYENTIKASVTGFITRIDQITLSRFLAHGQWQRFNGGRRETKGLEVALLLKPVSSIEFNGALTYSSAHDFPDKKKSPLIPTYKAAGGVIWYARQDLSFFVQGYGLSQRKATMNNFGLAPYAVIHMGGSYEVNKHAACFWRIENLTNKRYEEVFGYGARGRGFFIGVEAKT